MGNLRKYGSFDLDEAEKETKELESSGGADFMSLKVGRNVIRVLPPPAGARSPFKVIHQHFINVPGATGPISFVCPRLTLKKACAVCTEADALRASGNPVDADRANDLFARRRVFTNVIDRGAPEKGPRVLAFGKTIHEQLLALRTDAEAGGDYTDVADGFDIIIERQGTGKNDTKYSVRPARGNTPLADTEEQIDDWYNSQRSLDQFARVPSAAELAKLIGGDGEGEPVKRGKARALPASNAATSKRRSAQDDAIDAEFEEADDDA